MTSRNLILGVLALPSATGGGGGGPAPSVGPWRIDPASVATGGVLSAGDTAVLNDSGSIGFDPCWTLEAFPSDDQLYYWEVEITGGDSIMSGSIGIVDALDLPATGTDIGDQLLSVGLSGSGTVKSDGNNVATSATGTLGIGVIVMIAFNPNSGEIWFGTDGTWGDDPDVDAAVFTLPSSSTYRIGVRANEDGRKLDLFTEAADFTYTPPTGAVAPGSLTRRAEFDLDRSRLYTIEAPKLATQFSVDRSRIYTVTEG